MSERKRGAGAVKRLTCLATVFALGLLVTACGGGSPSTPAPVPSLAYTPRPTAPPTFAATQVPSLAPTPTLMPAPTLAPTSTPSSAATPATVSWDKLSGPQAGPITGISISKSDPSYVYVGTPGPGIFYSWDGGSNWSQGPSWLHHAQHVWASPHDPKRAYALPLRTTRDGGVTWTRSSLGERRSVIDIEYDPNDSAIIYAGGLDGVLKTTDGGKTWTLIELVLEGVKREVWKLASDPAKEGRIVAGLHPIGIGISTDFGETWTLLEGSSKLHNNLVFGLEMDRSDSDKIYVAVNGVGIFVMDQNGIEEIGQRLLGPGTLVFPSSEAFGLSADGATLYILAAKKPYPAEDTGPFAFELFAYRTVEETLRKVEVPAPTRSVAAHPEDPMTLYIGTDTGVYASSDGGSTWVRMVNGLVDNYLTTVSISPADSGMIVTGTLCSGGLFVSRDGGATWGWKRGGLDPWRPGVWGEHYVMHTAPSTGNMVYATTMSGLLISSDSGETWDLLDNDFSGDRFDHLHGIAVDPTNPQVLYVGTGRGGVGNDETDDLTEGSMIWKSLDGGKTWNQRTNGFPIGADTVIQQIVIDRNSTGVVYVVTNEEDYLPGGKGPNRGESVGIYKSTNGGDTWFPINSGLRDRNVHALAIDPNDSALIFAGTQGGVYKSVDGGEHWTLVQVGDVKSVVVHPHVSGLVFAAILSSTGNLLYSTDGGSTWVDSGPIFRRKASKPYSDYGIMHWLAIDGAGQYLYAATYGEGLWRTDLQSLLGTMIKTS